MLTLIHSRGLTFIEGRLYAPPMAIVTKASTYFRQVRVCSCPREQTRARILGIVTHNEGTQVTKKWKSLRTHSVHNQTLPKNCYPIYVVCKSP